MAQTCKPLWACLLAVCAALFAPGCKSLNSPTVMRNASTDEFKYAYVIPTGGLTSGSGNMSVLFGESVTRSVNPAGVIAGALMKRGYTVLHEARPDVAGQTMIVAYGESGRRKTGMGTYAIEVSIQFASAQTNEPLCSCVAEGRVVEEFGSVEADGIRQAIDRCLAALFDRRP